MGIVDFVSDLKGPVFYKDDSEAEKELACLKSLEPTPEIELQIKLVEAGIAGEKQILRKYQGIIEAPKERTKYGIG